MDVQMTDAMLHPNFETLSPDTVRAHQDRLWEAQWPYASTASVFYVRKIGGRARERIDLDDLASLPFTSKDELRCSQEAAYPFGDYVACNEDQVVRVHRTSGTT